MILLRPAMAEINNFKRHSSPPVRFLSLALRINSLRPPACDRGVDEGKEKRI